MFELNGTIYGKWVRNGITKIYYLNSSGQWADSSMSASSYISTLLFNNNGIFTDGTNIYVSRSGNTNLYKIIEAETDNLSYQSISIKSYPSQAASLSVDRVFSLGMNAKKGDAKARLYSTTIF